jgi:hypothetical protein
MPARIRRRCGSGKREAAHRMDNEIPHAEGVSHRASPAGQDGSPVFT